MNPRFRIFTSCNVAYLSQAKLLIDSIRRFHDDCATTLVLVEEKRRFPQSVHDCLDQFDEVIYPEDLWGAERFDHLFCYDVVEACTAVKGPALSYLLSKGQPVIYLDPDVVLFARLDVVLEKIEHSSVVLTPHQLFPQNHEIWGGNFDERISLLTGTFNFGFFAVNPDKEGREFAKWFDYRTTHQAYDLPSAGLFTDQKWGNLIPALFPRAHILRHKGMNVASWNIHERNIGVSDSGNLMVDDDPLVFFHFTKNWNGLEPIKQKAAENIYVASMWRWYLENLGIERSKIALVAWSYGRYFDSRQEIDQSARRAYRPIGSAQSPRPNPFFEFVQGVI